jgi:membrane protein
MLPVPEVPPEVPLLVPSAAQAVVANPIASATEIAIIPGRFILNSPCCEEGVSFLVTTKRHAHRSPNSATKRATAGLFRIRPFSASITEEKVELAGRLARCSIPSRDKLVISFLSSRHDVSDRRRQVGQEVQKGSDRPRPVSRAEYWAFLSIALLLSVAFLAPARSGSTAEAQKGSGSGAFGADRSTDELRVIQHKRAYEPGRGRHAEAPWQIPVRGWKDILWRTYQQIGEDRLLAVAAGVVFYGLLALFPAVTALVSLYGLFANASAINDHLSSLGDILPSSAVDIIHEQIIRLTSKGDTKLSFGFEEKEKRGFIKLNLVSLAFTLVAIASLLLALGAVVVLPLLLNQLGLSSITDTLFRVGRWPLLLALVIIGLALIYRLAPSRREPRWQWLTVGSIFAAAAWLGGSALLSWYLANFAHYDAAYGSLGAGIGLMMWMWVSSIVILFGAQLNSEIEHQTAKDSTVERDRPLGARGAVMADTVGEAVA